ncbi:MAG TPA: CoA-binding protein [Dehalococcoidia bacterium]|nr:CoA-binding protein [Dehalococcoidia bacterium]
MVEPIEEELIEEILVNTKRIAIVGMREQGDAGRIPRYLIDAGFEVVPVNPNFQEVFGIAALGSLDDLDAPVDMVQLFRRSGDVPMHIDEILRARPRYVWMQTGITNEEAAQTFREAGIAVVQDRCLMTEHRRRSIANLS